MNTGMGTWWTTAGAGLVFAAALAGCDPGRLEREATSSASTTQAVRGKGAQEATDAIAAGALKLKEYPPLPYPPGYQEYVALLRERCGVEYEVCERLPDVDEAALIRHVREWNAVMEAEIERVYGAGILERLREEAQRRRSEPTDQGPKASG
ncbi:MAG: hypothetical protein FJ297_08085 [Planctomycetes bacterium]|nr:hypothetical protein [Planctomycetota bacterium]